MSDTGGGHRASAEALKAGFEEKFGGQYQVSGRDQLQTANCKGIAAQSHQMGGEQCP